MPWKSDYEQAPDSDSSDETLPVIQQEKTRRYRKKSMSKRDLAFLLIPSIISVSTVIALLIMASNFAKNPAGHAINSPMGGHHADHEHHEIHKPGVKHCGHTSEQARALGCVFDTISFSWLVPECYDQELVDEFDKLEVKFPFFYDPDGKSEAPWSEVEKGDRAMYVPWSHHLWHCGFLWRKMHKAIIAGTPVDSYIGNYTHTEHCTQIMVEENRQHSMEDVNTIMALKFPYCGEGEQQWFGGTNFTRA